MCNPRSALRRCAAWLLVVTAAAVILPTPAHGQSVKNVLFLTAESPDLPANRVILDAIQVALRSEYPARVEFSVEAIDARQFANDVYERRFADLLNEKFRGVRLDLVIAVTQPGVDFVLREHDRLFATAPLLLGFIEARAVRPQAIPENSGLVLLKVDAASTVRLALHTYPLTRRVLVVGGTSRFDRGWEQIVRADLATLDADISIEYDTNSSLDDLVRHVADLPADAVVLFTSATRDRANAPVRSVDVIQRLRAVARVPIYGLSSTYLGHGIVGGTLLDFDRHGQDLAQRAVQLLRGQIPAPSTTANTTAVDWRELQRFGISADTLPAATVVAFRQLTTWQRYRTAILSVGFVVVGQAALIAALISMIRRRRKAEAAESGVESAAAAVALIERACNGQRSADQIEYLSAASSDARWLLMSAEPLRRPEGGAVVIHMDITQRKLTEIALRETEDRFRRLADGLPVAIWMSETDGRLSYVNEQWLRMTGRTLEDEIGDGWLGLVHPDDRDACARAVLGDRGQPRGFSVDYRLRQPDGQYRWLMNVGMPRFGTDGAFHGYVGGSIDITERREAEQMQRDLNIRLILAREEERRHIARELHDHLNQQLALLAIDIQQLTMKPPESPEALLQALQDAWQRTADIASDVHGISHRLHPSKLEALGLIATIRGHCRDVSRQSLQVHFTEHGATRTIPADVSLCLFRVVEEALSNAVRHSIAREAVVTLDDTPAEIVLRVSDSGRGFSSTGATSHGIGLVSMRERLHALGGTLVITSSPGKGTVVEARIPRVSLAERETEATTLV
jgi:PAS domain S-box-containing protein